MLKIVLGYDAEYLRSIAQAYSFVVVIEQRAKDIINAREFVIWPKFKFLVGVDIANAYAESRALIKSAGVALQMLIPSMTVQQVRQDDYHMAMLQQFSKAGQDVIYEYGNCPDDSLVGARNILANLDVIVKSPGIQDLFGAFAGKPGILVSSGPSLDKNIDVLKYAQGHAVIVCADSILRVLLAHGIKPNLVASIERFDEIADLWAGMEPSVFDNVYLASPPVLSPLAYAAFHGPKIMAYRDIAHLDWLELPKGKVTCGGSCSNLAFKILEKLGCDPIILVGQDLSYASLEKTHADGSPTVCHPALTEKDLVPVRGNYQDTVFTDSVFGLFLRQFVADVAGCRSKVINATEGGAWIEGTRLMTMAEVLEHHCQAPLDALAVIRERLKVPTADQVAVDMKSVADIISATRSEVMLTIQQCAEGLEICRDLHDIAKAAALATQHRVKVLDGGKHFDNFLLHIIQCLVVRSEIMMLAIPVYSDDPVRRQLQALRICREFFRDVCAVSQIALDALDAGAAGPV